MDLQFSIPFEPKDDEWIVAAFAGETPLGRTLVHSGDVPYISALERPVTMPGAYIRRVFTVESWRGTGIASAMLETALQVAVRTLDQSVATALIAVDNKPSQWLFENCGFQPVRVHEYFRVGPHSRYRTRAV